MFNIKILIVHSIKKLKINGHGFQMNYKKYHHIQMKI